MAAVFKLICNKISFQDKAIPRIEIFSKLPCIMEKHFFFSKFYVTQSGRSKKLKKEKSMTTENNPQVLMETSMGNIKIELFKDKAPITVRNFLSYVKDGYYDGLVSHRVIKN